MAILKFTAYNYRVIKCLRKRLRESSIVCLAMLLIMGMEPQVVPTSREYQIKAVFLYNFSQFVEWPEIAFSSAEAPLIIGILGKDPFGVYLDKTITGEKVNGHPLVIQRYSRVEEIGSCHILFINPSEANNVEYICKSVKGRSILTVSDTPDFLQYGGMIRFYTAKNKIQLQINPDAAKAANLKISSKLLRLAQIVPGKN